MTRTAKMTLIALAAAAILGGGLIAAKPHPEPISERSTRALRAYATYEACVVRAQETGWCVIAGRPARETSFVSGEAAATFPRGEGKAEAIRTKDLYIEVVPKVGILPTAEITGPAENAATQTQAAPYTEEELEIFACAIYQEAGGDGCSDLCRMYVGDVILNRVDDPRFPSTLYEVLTQKHQYGLFWKTGIIWPSRASDPNEAAAVERAYDTARALLEGEHSELFGKGYIYQDTKPRGKDVIYLDGEYFGR